MSSRAEATASSSVFSFFSSFFSGSPFSARRAASSALRSRSITNETRAARSVFLTRLRQRSSCLRRQT